MAVALSMDECALVAGDLALSPNWAYTFVSCDGLTAWSVEVAPSFRLNIGVSCTLQRADGGLRGVATLHPALRCAT